MWSESKATRYGQIAHLAFPAFIGMCVVVVGGEVFVKPVVEILFVAEGPLQVGVGITESDTGDTVKTVVDRLCIF